MAVTPEALAGFRIITSPVRELFASLSALAMDRLSPWPYSDWKQAAERALSHRPGGELVAWARQLAGPIPALLTPVPSTLGVSFDDEFTSILERLAHTPSRRLTELLGGSVRWAGRNPGDWAPWFSAAVVDYWRAALSPYWAAIQAAVGDDVTKHARKLAAEGAGSVLSTLDKHVRFEAPLLEVASPGPDRELRSVTRLLVVPLIFSRWAAPCVTDEAGTVVLPYHTQGTALLARSRPVRDTGSVRPERDRLALMVGRGRAAVLRGLVTPTTTSALADSLGMAVSTVSEHLNTLRAADVVCKRRIGVRVVYSLGESGVALLQNFGTPAS